ncbi:MAG TPA: phosphoribosylamine--glycine ligase [Polyangiaceae bacterium]|jgi:phosphoribosylamine--glycine ligase|nr:phosphoribosylamine--glycine ligase [Polyangiaceae bacterium]
MGTTGRKVLIVGSGGREHALAARLLSSGSVREVVVTPGNAGIEWSAARSVKPLRRIEGDAFDVARAEKPDLVVIGPEAPLVSGLTDRLRENGVAVFGPSRAAAQLEGSKAFMKDFVRRAGIPTARYEVVRDAATAKRVIESFAVPPVVKADGLCAGKGVVVAGTHAEALAAAETMLDGAAFGDAGRTVVVEERIAGAEASVHAICDGERVFVLPSAQDHKRIGDGDTGPNTGGMGAYAPAPLVTPAMTARIETDVFQRTVDRMAAEGAPFVGALFAGLMITPDGEPYLLEFNVRFGDPETQVLMNVLDGDLGDALDGAARGRLDRSTLSLSSRHALAVVLAAAGYPGTPRGGDVISGLDAAAALEGVEIYHAGTRRSGNDVLTAGGRVLGVTGRGATLAEAAERAYRAVDRISFPGMQFRRDIGARAR